MKARDEFQNLFPDTTPSAFPQDFNRDDLNRFDPDERGPLAPGSFPGGAGSPGSEGTLAGHQRSFPALAGSRADSMNFTNASRVV